MPIVRPGSAARAPMTPRRGLLKCGVRDADGYPMTVPYIVTRYAIPRDMVHKQERGDSIKKMPARIVDVREEDGMICMDIIHCSSKDLAEHRARLEPLIEQGSYDARLELLQWEPWTFRMASEDRKRAAKLGKPREREDLVTVLRLPEVELAFPNAGAEKPYGPNPIRIKIQLPYTEGTRQDRITMEEQIGTEPDYNCFTEGLKNHKGGKAFCVGNGVTALRRGEGKSKFPVPCIPWPRNEDGTPNSNVCDYIGRWQNGQNGPYFEEPRGKCKEMKTFTFRIFGVHSLHVYQLTSASGASGDNIREILRPIVHQFNGRVQGYQFVLSIKQQLFNPLDKRTGKELTTYKPVWVMDNDPEFTSQIQAKLGGSAMGFLRQLAGSEKSNQPVLQLGPPTPEFDDSEDEFNHTDEFFPDGRDHENSQPPKETLDGWLRVMNADGEYNRLRGELEKTDAARFAQEKMNRGLTKYFNDSPTEQYGSRRGRVIDQLKISLKARNEGVRQATQPRGQAEQQTFGNESPSPDVEVIVPGEQSDGLSDTEKRGLDSMEEDEFF